MFEINQIVRGKVSGRFVIIGFRSIDGEEWAQLKEVDESGKFYTGEIALPISKLKLESQ